MKDFNLSKREQLSLERQFNDKVIIITGASSGIGLASAKLFYLLGAKIVMVARNKEKLELAAKSINKDLSNILVIPSDVSIASQCESMVQKTLEHFSRIDILINNAGIVMRAMFKDVDLSVLHKLMDINFWGTVNCTKYALPHLLQSKGSVVGVVSIAAYSPLPARSAYASSKFAIRGFLDTLRVEHLYDDLHVMVFAPGYTASNIRNTALRADGLAQGESPLDESKLMSAEDCAIHLAKGLASRKSELILTFLGKITVLLQKFFPRLLDKLTYNYISKEPNSPFKKAKDDK